MMQKIYFYNLYFVIKLNRYVVIIRINPTPSDYENNFKEMGKIPCGFDTNETILDN